MTFAGSQLRPDAIIPAHAVLLAGRTMTDKERKVPRRTTFPHGSFQASFRPDTGHNGMTGHNGLSENTAAGLSSTCRCCCTANQQVTPTQPNMDQAKTRAMQVGAASTMQHVLRGASMHIHAPA